MIGFKDAIQRAKDFARDVLGEDDLLLEEVSSDDQAFYVTLSLPRRAGKRNLPHLEHPLARTYAADREFKEIRVLKQDGSVESMKIRAIA